MKKSVVFGLAGLAAAAVTGAVVIGVSGAGASSHPAGAPAPVADVHVADVALTPAAQPAAGSSGTFGSPATGSSPSALLDLASAEIHVRQKGAVVTVLRGSSWVASMTLADARYTHTSAHALVTITSKQKVKIDTSQFKVFVDDGDLAVSAPKVRTLPAGTHSVSVDVTGAGAEPRGFGWNGTGDDATAVWLRS
jgi:hypothetical protein